jgi:H+/Cl- antiporter ClcA
MDALVAAGILGIAGGAVGSLFIRVNNLLNLIRKKVLTTKLRKIFESALLVFLTVTAFFISSLYSSCRDASNPDDPLVKN